MEIKIGKQTWLALSLTGILGLFSATAFAMPDGKTAPGLACVDTTNQDEVSYSAYSGSIQNALNESNRVVCPIVREQMAAENDHFKNVQIRLQKANTDNVDCWLDSRNAVGDFGVFAYGYVVGAGYRQINLGQNIQSFFRGTFTIACDLNGYDRIYSYLWDED